MPPLLPGRASCHQKFDVKLTGALHKICQMFLWSRGPQKTVTVDNHKPDNEWDPGLEMHGFWDYFSIVDAHGETLHMYTIEWCRKGHQGTFKRWMYIPSDHCSMCWQPCSLEGRPLHAYPDWQKDYHELLQQDSPPIKDKPMPPRRTRSLPHLLGLQVCSGPQIPAV